MQNSDSSFESRLEILQLTINRDAKCHKGPSGWVNLGMLAAKDLLYHLGKL